MNDFRYKVEFTSNLSLFDLKKRLAEVCEGAWVARPRSLSLLSKNNRRYQLGFELECDLMSLVNPKSRAA